jgi:hypothetical protein
MKATQFLESDLLLSQIDMSICELSYYTNSTSDKKYIEIYYSYNGTQNSIKMYRHDSIERLLLDICKTLKKEILIDPENVDKYNYRYVYEIPQCLQPIVVIKNRKKYIPSEDLKGKKFYIKVTMDDTDVYDSEYNCVKEKSVVYTKGYIRAFNKSSKYCIEVKLLPNTFVKIDDNCAYLNCYLPIFKTNSFKKSVSFLIK